MIFSLSLLMPLHYFEANPKFIISPVVYYILQNNTFKKPGKTIITQKQITVIL